LTMSNDAPAWGGGVGGWVGGREGGREEGRKRRQYLPSLRPPKTETSNVSLKVPESEGGRERGREVGR
jgi:hypothetical protein